LTPVKTVKLIKRFVSAEDGLVTVEWVALAGAAAIGAIACVWLVLNGDKAPASAIAGNLASCETYAATHHGSTAGCK
jgi:hypothetical protein